MHAFDGHKLIISDNSYLAQPIDEEAYWISFHDKSRGSREDDGIHTWTPIRRLRWRIADRLPGGSLGESCLVVHDIKKFAPAK